MRTSAGPPYPPPLSEEQKRYYLAELGPGAFRSRSRFFVDQNPRSRENVMRDALKELLGETFVKIRPAFLLNPSTKKDGLSWTPKVNKRNAKNLFIWKTNSLPSNVST